jgi:uncharacterized Zn finger protein (UPF0148 family)
MAEPSITCPSCGKKIPLTRALRTEIEASVKEDYDRRLNDEVERARKQAGKDAEKKSVQELAATRRRRISNVPGRPNSRYAGASVSSNASSRISNSRSPGRSTTNAIAWSRKQRYGWLNSSG